MRRVERVGRRVVVVVVTSLLAAGCGGGGAGEAGGPTPASTSTPPAEQRYPDIVDVTVERTGEETFSFTVTVSSPYDTPERYADGWRVLGPDGKVHDEHTLLHHHAGEQPFTRTKTGVEIPPDVEEVTVEGRDLRYGYGGDTVVVAIPHG